MFRGQFVHAIDAKGRLSVPTRFRELLLPRDHDRFIVTPDPFDPCLQLHPLPAWEALAAKFRAAGVSFVIEPYVRFRGEPGEQATMFFLDPFGNALEFKAFREMASLFAT